MSQFFPFSICALVLINSHWTNATFYYRDKQTLEEDLRAEIPPRSLARTISRSFSGSHSSLSRMISNGFSSSDSSSSRVMRNGSSGSGPSDTVCDKLYPVEKQSLCDSFMKFLILKEHGSIFESFVETGARLSVPQIANSNDPFTCKELSIETENLTLEKPMFWCRPRQYKKNNVDDLGVIDGLFCAGSRREKTNRVFFFRPPQIDSQKVNPVGEMENIPIVKGAMGRNR